MNAFKRAKGIFKWVQFKWVQLIEYNLTRVTVIHLNEYSSIAQENFSTILLGTLGTLHQVRSLCTMPRFLCVMYPKVLYCILYINI